MKYNEVVNKENEYKVYLCKLTNGSTVELQVHDTCEFDNKEVFVFYNFEDNDDSKAYFEEDVAEVIELIEHELGDDNESSFDSMDFKSIVDYLINADTWQYSNREELDQIIKALDNPIISGGGWSDEDTVKYLDSQEKDYGIVFYWSEYDDFSCYGDGFTHHVKIIEGVKKV